LYYWVTLEINGEKIIEKSSCLKMDGVTSTIFFNSLKSNPKEVASCLYQQLALEGPDLPKGPWPELKPRLEDRAGKIDTVTSVRFKNPHCWEMAKNR